LRLQNAGQRVRLNVLWALEGALSNRDWREVAREDRTRVLMELDDRQRR
jgi:DNA transformation protein and related proteins